MVRPPRLEFPGAAYHVTARGNERSAVFRDDDDRRRYLRLLAVDSERDDVKVYAYSLMGNHVHLLVETGRVPLSRFMKAVHATYAQYFNRRYGRSGHLFQGRYKAFLIEKERYLLAVVRYIHRNPVRARLVDRPQDHVWTSHRSYLGQAPQWLAAKAVLRRFGTAFVADQEKTPLEELTGPGRAPASLATGRRLLRGRT